MSSILCPSMWCCMHELNRLFARYSTSAHTVHSNNFIVVKRLLRKKERCIISDVILEQLVVN